MCELTDEEFGYYIQDSLRLILAQRPSRPLLFIQQYLKSVITYDNVAGREWAYINATAHNRKAFILALWDAFSGKSSVATAPQDVTQLAMAVCSDIPPQLLTSYGKIAEEVVRIVEPEKELRFAGFLRAFFVYLYYQDFFKAVAGIFSDSQTLPIGSLFSQLRPLCARFGVPVDEAEAALRECGSDAVSVLTLSARVVSRRTLSDALLLRPACRETSAQLQQALTAVWDSIAEEADGRLRKKK